MATFAPAAISGSGARVTGHMIQLRLAQARKHVIPGCGGHVDISFKR